MRGAITLALRCGMRTDNTDVFIRLSEAGRTWVMAKGTPLLAIGAPPAPTGVMN